MFTQHHLKVLNYWSLKERGNRDSRYTVSCLSSPLGITTLSDTLHPYKVRHRSLQRHLIPTMEENENQSSRKNHINPTTAPHQTVRSSSLASELWCKRCVGRWPDIHHAWHLTVSLSELLSSSHYYKMPSIIPPNININLLFRDENVRQIRSFLCNLDFILDEMCPNPGQTQSLTEKASIQKMNFNNDIWHVNIWYVNVNHSSRNSTTSQD